MVTEFLGCGGRGRRWLRRAAVLLSLSALSALAVIRSATIPDPEDRAVAIYSRDSGGFSPQTVVHQRDRSFGISLSVSGAVVAIGADNAAYIYAKSGPGWVKQARLTAFGQYFGEGVAVSGSALVVGALGAFRHFVGLAYFYQRSGGAWHRVARFRDPNSTRLGAFGLTTAVSGRRALVAAPSDFTPSDPLASPASPLACGSVYEFVKSAGRWRYRAKVANPGCTPGDQFGSAMAIVGDTAVIGAPTKNHDHGGVYVLTIP